MIRFLLKGLLRDRSRSLFPFITVVMRRRSDRPRLQLAQRGHLGA